MLKKINYIFDAKQKRNLILLFLMIVVGAFVELLGVTAILPFVDVIVSTDKIFNNNYLNSLYHFVGAESVNYFLVVLAVGLILIYILKNVYIGFMYNVQYRFTYNNQRRLADRMMNCYLKQNYLFHVQHGSPELLRNIGADTGNFYLTVLAFLQLATELVVTLVLFIFLLIQDKTITIAVSGILLSMMLVFLRIYKKKLKVLGETNRINAELTSKWLLQALGGVKESKILEREQFFLDNYHCYNKKLADTQRKYQTMMIMPRPILETICITALLGVVSIKILRGVQLDYFISTLAVFSVAAFRLLPSINRITSHLNTIMFYGASVEAVYNDIKDMEGLSIKNSEIVKNDGAFKLENEIHLKNIKFHYPNTNKLVIDNAELLVKVNTSVALIGPSGEGKTTLADIILGILEPEEGTILVDGKDIYSNIHNWHRSLGYIPQTIYLMDDTIRNNIAFGIPAEEINEQRLWEVLEEAQLKDFIDKLELGLDTKIGERGVRLSGGQRQRIGIARALYGNPSVLVLDEATSALDNDTEKAVMEAIDGFAGKKTLIIIAHRLTTVKNCDEVYEVNNGKINLVKLNV